MIRSARWMPMAMCLLAAEAALGQNVQFVEGSTEPRVQLTGEHFQMYVDGTYFSEPTPVRSLTRYGVLGTDLGFPISVGDRTMLLFGDTVGAYRSGDRFYVSRGNPPGAGDSIGYFTGGEYARCQYIRTIADQLARGQRPAADASGCPTIQFFTNPVRGAEEHVFKPLVIDGLNADESQATFRVPTSAVMYQDHMYVFHTTRMQDEQPAGAFWLQSVLARSNQPAHVWSDASPPGFTRLATISSHPHIADPANPPPVTSEGKFIYAKAVVMEGRQLADLRLAIGLPRQLQSAPDVVFVFATAFNARQSDLYLAAFDLREIDRSPASWFYYAGPNNWTTTAGAAVGLLNASDVSHHSVSWSPSLRRFVLLRPQQAMVAQFAAAPWGPWSAPQAILKPTDAWATRLLRRPGNEKIVQSLEPIYLQNGTRMALPDEELGAFYGPSVVGESRNGDGSVALFYTLSTWNPYQVFLFSSTFRP